MQHTTEGEGERSMQTGWTPLPRYLGAQRGHVGDERYGRLEALIKHEAERERFRGPPMIGDLS